jgi:serine/threonine protein kinase
MDTKTTCQHCGKVLGPEAIEGLCPDCLMKMGMGLGTEASEAGAQRKRAFTPPTPTELAPKFPQFEILALIGQGGMGAVYKARQRQLDRVVALKILPPGIGEDSGFADRFTREAKAMAKLNHPGIVTIHDFGHAEGLYYFIMELVDGVSLSLLMHNGRVSSREALAIVPQICDALQYAHDQGIVHRAIKPENILLDRQGRVKVADFGLAKLVGSANQNESVAGGATTDSSSLTEAGKVMGTPRYMAPEQADHPGEVDHRADIYALGVVFYQMLTGELPAKRIEPPSRKVRIDVRLDEVVLRALEREPDHRYQQVSQVKTAVETIAQTSMPKTRNELRTTWKAAFSSKRRIFVGMGLAIFWLLLFGVLFTILRSYRSKAAAQLAAAQNSPAAIRAELNRVKVPPEAAIDVLATAANEGDLHQKQIPEWVTLKALNGWIADLQNSDPSIKKLAERAITEMGTNALPEFLKILDDRDHTLEGDTRRYYTAAALRFIGPDLKPWIPSFNSLLLSGNEQTAYAGARALASTTPIVPEAFAQLTNGLVNPAAGVRDAASHGVGLLLGSESNHLAESALPILLHNLKDKAQFIRSDTAGALMMYVQFQQTHGHDAKPDLIIPPIIELLQDPYSYSRQNAEWILRDYGKTAIPVLLKLLNDPDSRVREDATNAMTKIGSWASLAGSPRDAEGQKVQIKSQHVQFYYIRGGGVALPARRVFQPGLTVTAAIKACGGFTAEAIKEKAELTREGSNAPLVINLTAIEQGKAPNPEIMPGDTLFVPSPPPR